MAKYIEIDDGDRSNDSPAELAAYEAIHDAASALADVEPTTPAGLAALLRFGLYALGEQKARAFKSARAETGAEAAGDACDDAANRECRAEMDVVRAPAATLTDLDRKLCILADNLDRADWPWSVAAQLRADLAALDPALAVDHQSSPG